MAVVEDLLAKTNCADEEAFLVRFALAAEVPGLCLRCRAIEPVEPDQGRGWCDPCGQNSIVSGLVLLGFIPGNGLSAIPSR